MKTTRNITNKVYAKKYETNQPTEKTIENFDKYQSSQTEMILGKISTCIDIFCDQCS